MESATDTVALDWLKPVFRWVFAAGFALCFANLIYLILMSEERYHYAVMAVLLVLGGFLGWFIAEMKWQMRLEEAQKMQQAQQQQKRK